MLLLIFQIGEGRYALDAGVVIEVIPRINCKHIPLVPDYVAGIINYHGKPVPVIDLCAYHDLGICKACLSTRIIMVNHVRKDFKNVHVGLIAEQVTETVFVDDDSIYKSSVLIELGQITGEHEESRAIVQWYDLDHLFTENLLDEILQE